MNYQGERNDEQLQKSTGISFPRIVVVAIFVWTLLTVIVSTVIPLDYPTDQKVVDEASPWVYAAVAVGTVLLTALDVVQHRRRKRRRGE